MYHLLANANDKVAMYEQASIVFVHNCHKFGYINNNTKVWIGLL